jgi:glutamate synthase domain-containing protein 2
VRKPFVITALVILGLSTVAAWQNPPALWSLVIIGPLLAMGLIDYFQTRHSIRRNFPLLGRFRYWLEAIRPEINQYFVESDTDGKPFTRNERSLIYQRAKRVMDTQPFGTQDDVYKPGYEWVNHSMAPVEVDTDDLRITVGGPECSQPYVASLLSISAMSYGALGSTAILSLNGGAKDGGFAHNTGEGGISPFHLEHGGDLIWQIGTGYFGCRTLDGTFSEELFAQNANRPEVKMVELKISQGAKPGHGGILPAKKVSPEIAEIRNVPLGQDVISPPAHATFSTPTEMVHFLAVLRELSGGKPVGFKLCIGKRREFLAICKAMVETGICPDFVAIDGGEGGTGAAPVEFANHIGSPGVEGLIFAHNALIGFGLRERIRVIASGKVSTGFGIIKKLALGADLTYSARAMMMALGCIQALRCNANDCPTGVATQDPHLVTGLVPADKRKRVAAFHAETIDSCAHILGTMGLSNSNQLRPWHVMRRIGPTDTRHFGELYRYLKPGELLGEDPPPEYSRALSAATAESFAHANDLASQQQLVHS